MSWPKEINTSCIILMNLASDTRNYTKTNKNKSTQEVRKAFLKLSDLENAIIGLNYQTTNYKGSQIVHETSNERKKKKKKDMKRNN